MSDCIYDIFVKKYEPKIMNTSCKKHCVSLLTNNETCNGCYNQTFLIHDNDCVSMIVLCSGGRYCNDNIQKINELMSNTD